MELLHVRSNNTVKYDVNIFPKFEIYVATLEESKQLQKFLFKFGYKWMSRRGTKPTQSWKPFVGITITSSELFDTMYLATVHKHESDSTKITSFQELKNFFGIPHYTFEQLDVL